VKLTENCQARCVSCDYWKTRWKDGINTDRAIALVNEIDELGIRSLRFTGGEPLIRKDFFAFLKRSRADHFKRIIIQTNGLLLKRFYEQVNDSPITNVNVSIDGMRDSNDRIRGIQAEAMVRRECPSCTCGIESSLAMKNAVSSAFFELGRLLSRSPAPRHPLPG
jgi:molybdenum cofactor biosynthesis enzyme MoaA